jgi:predicted nucleotidyltransferase
VPTEEAIADAGRILADAARTPARVILFGSWARGDAGPDSDLDFLVIEQDGGDGHLDEMTRLRDCLPALGVPVDVVVVSEELAERRRKVPGTMIHTALREGRLVAESSADRVRGGLAAKTGGGPHGGKGVARSR